MDMYKAKQMTANATPQSLPQYSSHPQRLAVEIQPQGGDIFYGDKDTQPYRIFDGQGKAVYVRDTSRVYIKSADSAEVNVALIITGDLS